MDSKNRTYIILSEKKWNDNLIDQLYLVFESINWIKIDSKEKFNYDFLLKIKPDKIFIPHWSYIISENIYRNFECIVFHMTDLPYGRGGSPLQNLIVNGHISTKISALRVIKELDAGPVFLKKNLSLLGTAEEIFIRANKIIQNMIIEIIQNDLKPKKQDGKIIKFKRRNKKDSDISKLENLEKVYDFIRMLDAEGYPGAYIENEFFKFEFSRASLKSNGEIIADVKIFKK